MNNKCSECKLPVGLGEWHHCRKTPKDAKLEIRRRFSVLINRGMLKVKIKGKILTLTGVKGRKEQDDLHLQV